MPAAHHHEGHSLYYRKTGTGNKVVLWFHGFGQQHLAFDKVQTPELSDCTHYSFDLFFHGNSHWAGSSSVEKKDLQELFQRFLEENKIDTFSVVAFSIGCRFGLSLAESFPDKLQKLVLLAPDGIQTRFWYWLATYPALSRKIFRYIITQPRFWHRLLSFLELTRLIDRKLLRFAQRQMDSQPKRQQVYNTWVNFRHLKSNTTTLSGLMKDHPFSLTLIAGLNDRLVPASLVAKLKGSLPLAQFHTFAAYHNDLIGISSGLIRNILNNQ